MKGKGLRLNTTKDKFFRQYLEVVRVMPPFNKLRSRELDVLAELLRYNDYYKEVPHEDRWALILHYKTKNNIKARLNNMSTANFNNILTSFRQKNILIDNKIPENYLIIPEDEFEFKINFSINAD